MVALNPSDNEVSVDLPEGILEITPESIDAPESASLTHEENGLAVDPGAGIRGIV